MAFQRIHQSRSQKPQTSSNTSQFKPRPFSVQDTKHPPTQADIENKAFQQNKLEAFALQLKEKQSTITPVEQERLGVLQAKMDSFWAERLERAKAQPKVLEILDRNSQTTQTTESQRPIQSNTIQAKSEPRSDLPDSFVEQHPNKTGMPDALKAGVESLSGYSLDDVRVHYNSPKPAQLQALAYTQGTEIHVASGQEKHLPHEAWHFVQQMQGRVKPTMQMKDGLPINDDAGLEHEADVMGAKVLSPAAQSTGGAKEEELLQGKLTPTQRKAPEQDDEIEHVKKSTSGEQRRHPAAQHSSAFRVAKVVNNIYGIQRELADAVDHSSVSYYQSAPPIQMVREGDFVADPEDFMSNNVVLFEYGKGFFLRYPQTVDAISGRIPANNLIANIKLLMAKNKDDMSFYLQDSGTKAQDDKPIYFTTPALGLLPDAEIKSIFMNGDIHLTDADDLVTALKEEDGGGENVRANYVPYFIDNPNLKTDGSGDKDADTWDNVGHSVVDPRVIKFVFTDAMNGCAYAITKVEGDDVRFEAWHFQNESDNFDQASHFRATKAIRDWFGVNDYYIGDGSTNLATTNIIWNSDNGTKMLSQKNIVPLNNEDSTSFQESTSHDLNVSEDIQEDHLVNIHSKLKRGIGKFVKQADVNVLNQRIQALNVDLDVVQKSLQNIRVSERAMSDTEVMEINRLPDNIAKNKVHASSYPVDLTMFDDLAGFKQALIDISSPGRLYGTNYDREKTLPLKQSFLKVSTGLFSKVSNLVNEAKQIVVTTRSDELNQDLYDICHKLRFYLDIYEEYGPDFQCIDDVIGRLRRLVNYKKAITRKNQTLADERATLFPS